MSAETEKRDQAKIERLMDNAGLPFERASYIVNGSDLSRVVGAATVFAATENFHSKSVHHLRPSKRGGRSYPEPGDSELDPEWSVHREDLVTAEQSEIDRGGTLLIRAVSRFVRQDAVAAMSEADRNRAVSSFMQGYSEGRVG